MGDGSSGRFSGEFVVALVSCIVAGVSVAITIGILLWQGGAFKSQVEGSFDSLQETTEGAKAEAAATGKKVDKLADVIAGADAWAASEGYMQTMKVVKRSRDQLADAEAILSVWLENHRDHPRGSTEWKDTADIRMVLVEIRGTRCSLAGGTFDVNSSQCTGVRGWQQERP